MDKAIAYDEFWGQSNFCLAISQWFLYLFILCRKTWIWENPVQEIKFGYHYLGSQCDQNQKKSVQLNPVTLNSCGLGNLFSLPVTKFIIINFYDEPKKRDLRDFHIWPIICPNLMQVEWPDFNKHNPDSSGLSISLVALPEKIRGFAPTDSISDTKKEKIWVSIFSLPGIFTKWFKENFPIDIFIV